MYLNSMELKFAYVTRSYRLRYEKYADLYEFFIRENNFTSNFLYFDAIFIFLMFIINLF